MISILVALLAAGAAWAAPLAPTQYKRQDASSMSMASAMPMSASMSMASAMPMSASLSMAAPMPSSSSSMNSTSTAPTDTQVLQYALTLEHLEATFYSQALDKFSAQDFTDSATDPVGEACVGEVMEHEKSHVALLTAALGNSSVAACTYKFPYTDVRSFLVLACGLENIGTSAYLGAAGYITTPEYLAVAASITTVEARHQSFFYGPVLKQAPWTGPYDTPLGLDMVYTLAALIESCPDSNAVCVAPTASADFRMLPVSAAPPLTIMGSPIANAAAGATIQVAFNASSSMSGMHAAVYNGLGSTVVDVSDDMMITLPDGIQGYSYLLITTASDIASVSMSNVVAGPAEIQTSFNSQQSNPGFMNPFGA